MPGQPRSSRPLPHLHGGNRPGAGLAGQVHTATMGGASGRGLRKRPRAGSQAGSASSRGPAWHLLLSALDTVGSGHRPSRPSTSPGPSVTSGHHGDGQGAWEAGESPQVLSFGPSQGLLDSCEADPRPRASLALAKEGAAGGHRLEVRGAASCPLWEHLLAGRCSHVRFLGLHWGPPMEAWIWDPPSPIPQG